jgi:hypothetical protein
MYRFNCYPAPAMGHALLLLLFANQFCLSIKHSGRRFPKSKHVFPKLGQAFPKLGQGFPKLGQAFPKLGQSFPKLGQSFPKFGRGFPLLKQNAKMQIHHEKKIKVGIADRRKPYFYHHRGLHFGYQPAGRQGDETTFGVSQSPLVKGRFIFFCKKPS